jgi:hypothetical protein
MSRACTICQHSRRPDIDRALATGESIRGIAGRFGVPRTNLTRHSSHAVVAAAEAVREAEHGLELWKQLHAINAVCLTVLQQAQRSGDGRLALLAVDRVHRQLELSARLLGQLNDPAAATTVSVTLQSEWPMLRQRIVGALEPFPDAREAVLVSLNGHARG